MRRYLVLILIALSLITVNCTTAPRAHAQTQVVGHITQADVDHAYREGFRLGNRQGYDRGYDSGVRGNYLYTAPVYRVGFGYRVYSRGTGYSDSYGLRTHKNVRNVTNVTNVTNVKNVKNVKNIKNTRNSKVIKNRVRNKRAKQIQKSRIRKPSVRKAKVRKVVRKSTRKRR